MDKQKLVRFINKYHLNKTVNSVVLNSGSSKLQTRFISGDKNLLGNLEMEGWTFEDSQIGVYNTEQLLKLISIMDNDISVSLTKSGEKAISLKVSDSSSVMNYMLSDVSVINEPPNLKHIPEFEISIDVNQTFITKFIAAKDALGEAENFTVLTDGVDTKLIINYASVNTNRVTIPVTTPRVADINQVSFSANLFKEVLSANKECESATLEISSQGLAKIVFKIDDFTSTYWLVGTKEID